MKKIRLHQYLSRSGIFARKQDLLDAITHGHIRVHDTVVTDPHYFIGTRKDVFYKDKRIKPITKKIYVALNKPVGFLSSKLTVNDRKLHKKSVFDLLADSDFEGVKNTLFCVGRLDEDTSGLLLLTNDGCLSNNITDPESTIVKTYAAVLRTPLTAEQKKMLEQGVVIFLEENDIRIPYKTKPATILGNDKKITLQLVEGKKREVRRMLEAVGNSAISLERVSIGSLHLKDLTLASGRYMMLTPEHVALLQQSKENHR